MLYQSLLYPLQVDIHPGVVDIHPEAVGIHQEAVGIHQEAVGIHPGAVGIHLEVVDIHPEVEVVAAHAAEVRTLQHRQMQTHKQEVENGDTYKFNVI